MAHHEPPVPGANRRAEHRSRPQRRPRPSPRAACPRRSRSATKAQQVSNKPINSSGDLHRDIAWYRANRSTLLRQYRGEHVAIIDAQIVDHDRDFSALAARVFTRYGNRDIYMPRIQAADPVAQIRSPRRSPDQRSNGIGDTAPAGVRRGSGTPRQRRPAAIGYRAGVPPKRPPGPPPPAPDPVEPRAVDAALRLFVASFVVEEKQAQLHKRLLAGERRAEALASLPRWLAVAASPLEGTDRSPAGLRARLGDLTGIRIAEDGAGRTTIARALELGRGVASLFIADSGAAALITGQDIPALLCSRLAARR